MAVVIVLDPGHGGIDPGTENNGYQEKTLVLSTCLLLRDALVRCGFQVILTRTTDQLPDPTPNATIAEDLTYRAQIANNAKANLFVAWHIDSASTSDVSGVAAWIHPSTQGTRTETWAQKIVDSIAADSGQKDRGVYLGDFAVLRETNMDAVLIEAGFLSNATEAHNLADANFQRLQAEGAAKGICTVFDVPYVAPPQLSTPTNPAPKPAPTPPTAAETIPSWAAEAVQKMREWGIMTGYADGKWHPNDIVTRAELASALTRFHDFLQKGTGGA